MFHRMDTPNPAPLTPTPPSKILLTKKELSAALPMPTRTIEKLQAHGVIPVLCITSRMVRYELPAVLKALRRYQTATIK